MSSRIIDYKLAEHDLKLKIGEDAFVPNLTTQILADVVEVDSTTTVLDLGCGVGPLAILAAKRGAKKVYAVDVLEKACEYAQYNAEANGVADIVEVRHGSLFEPLDGLKFDIIIDDVSGMSEKISRISPWYPQSIPTGGEDGTGPTIQMLAQAKDHFTEKCKLYFPVLSLADSKKILAKAHEMYADGLEEISERMIPFCEEFKAQIDELEQLKREGFIDYVKRRSRYLWSLKVFRVSAASL